MADVAITSKPTTKPSYQTAPQRQSSGSRVMKVTWKVPSSATKSDNPARITGVAVLWDVDCVAINDSKKTLRRNFVQRANDPSLTSFQLNLDSWKSVQFPNETWTRDTFYPGATDATHEWTKMWCVRTVRVGVYFYNGKGDGPKTITSMSFTKPSAPTISALTQGADSGEVTCKVTVPKGDGKDEVHSGWVTRDVYDSRTKSRSVAHYVVSRGGSRSVTYDVSDRMQLSYSQYVRVTVSAKTRGFWGDNEAKPKTLYVSWPNQPTIVKNGVTFSSVKKSSSDKVTVQLTANATTEHPTTGVRLQALANSEYSKASLIPGDASWTDLAVDDGQCTALSCDVGSLQSDPGKWAWIRVKAWNQIEDVFYRYSAPRRMDELYVKPDTAADDSCTVHSLTPTTDGKGIKAVIKYKEDTHNTGTEVTWSTNFDAWTSTQQPDSFTFTWKDSETSSGGYFNGTTTVYIRGLDIDEADPGRTKSTKFYVRARRYHESDDGTTYTPWSARKGCVMTDTQPASDEDGEGAAILESATLVTGGTRPRGTDVSFTWMLDGEAEQVGWELYTGTSKAVTTTVPDATPARTVTTYTLTKPQVVASGTDGRGACEVTAQRLSELFGAAKTKWFAVRAYYSGGYVESEAAPLTLADAPKLTVTGGVVDEQPASVGMTCTTQSDVAMVVRSMGASGDAPEGTRTQADGDVVWSAVISPVWSSAQLSTTNLCTNNPDNWERGGITTGSGGGDDFDETDMVRISKGAAIPVTPSTTYTLSLTRASGATASYSYAFQAYDANGDHVSSESISTFRTSKYTWTPSTSTSIRVVVKSSTDAYTDEIGTDARVQLQTGSAATTWTPCGDDLQGLTATVALPDGLDLWDGSQYEVTATATDRTYGLVSEPTTATLDVTWDRQAPPLGDNDVSVTATDTTDADGNRSISATIDIGTPTGATASDKLDLYRVTPDGAALVLSDLSIGDTVIDPYAPYGDTSLAYRVAIRTADGDTSWADYPYSLVAKHVRIDYIGDHGQTYVELPYNLQLSDSRSKDFEARAKLNGSTHGYWNAAVAHTGSVRSDLIRIEDGETAARLAELGRSPYAALVRMPNGCCYAADVEVSDIGRSYSSSAIAVSISTTQVEDDGTWGAVRTEGV